MTTTLQRPSGGVFYWLESIVEPLDFSRVFTVQQPVELELGSGDGSFLVAYASMHRDVNFLGAERLMGRLRKIERKALRAGIENVRTVRIEISYLTQYLIPLGSLRAIHIYFPDPWPKRRHRRHRIVNESFPSVARKALQPGGTVFLRTDDADYFAQMQDVFGKDKRFRVVETPLELIAIVTDFEREFNARGISTLRAAYSAVG